MDCSPPGSSVHGILQVRILEWVAVPASRGSSQPRDWTPISYVSCIAGQFFTTSAPWEAPAGALVKPGFKLEESSVFHERKPSRYLSSLLYDLPQLWPPPRPQNLGFLEVSRTGNWWCGLSERASLLFKKQLEDENPLFPSDRNWGFSVKNRVKFPSAQAPPLLGTPEPWRPLCQSHVRPWRPDEKLDSGLGS